MGECIFFVKMNSWVRRVPKEPNVLVPVNYHDNTYFE